jgi:hypothetical protein
MTSPSKKTAHASEQERADVAAQRQAWFDAQPDLDPEDLVFICSSTRPQFPPSWPGCAGVRPADSDAERRSRMGNGKRSPSSLP